jgi:hypothetical protein
MKYPWKMQDESVNPEFEAMLTRGLESAPAVDVPVDFAARVRAALPPVQTRRASTNLGRKTALGALVVLSLSLFALAPHAAPTFGSVAFDVELLVIAQLGGIAYWLMVRRGV